MKRTSDLVEILEANFGHRILIYYLYKKHQRPSSRILTRHLVHPSCLRCEKGMESHDNNMKTVKGRQTGTQRNFVKCLVWKRVLVEKKKWRPPDDKNMIILGQHHSRWLVFKGEVTVQDPESDSNDGRYQPKGPRAAEKEGEKNRIFGRLHRFEELKEIFCFVSKKLSSSRNSCTSLWTQHTAATLVNCSNSE